MININTMKKLTLPILAVIFSTSLSGCGLVEDAFKAGLIFAVVIIAIIGLLIWILRFTVNNLNKRFVFMPIDRKNEPFKNKA